MSSYVLPSSIASRTGVAELAVPTSNPASRSTAAVRALPAGSSATTSTRAATALGEFALATAMTLLLPSIAVSCRAMDRGVSLVPTIDVPRKEREDVAEDQAVEHVLDQGGQGHGSHRVDRRRRQRHLSEERRHDDQAAHDPPRQAVQPTPQGQPDLVQHLLGAGQPAEDSTDDHSVDQAGNPPGQRAVGMKRFGGDEEHGRAPAVRQGRLEEHRDQGERDPRDQPGHETAGDSSLHHNLSYSGASAGGTSAPRRPAAPTTYCV